MKRFGYAFALVLALLCARAHAQALDVSKLQSLSATQARIETVFQGFNRGTKESRYELRLTNLSGAAFHGPVYVIVSDVSPAAVTVKNGGGTASTGGKYFVMSAADLAAGVTVTQSLVFGNPDNVRFTFNTAAYETPVVQTPPPALQVQITHPGTLITVGSTPIAIDGTVSDDDATLTVNGAPITHAGGTFHANVALIPGNNVIIARAVNGAGAEATATISVSLDVTPPYITIESPKEGDVLTSAVITVSGLINDIVRGTVSDGQANVTVNGHPASVSNRSYLAQNVPLQEGANTIRVEGADQVGNTSVQEVHVTYQPPTRQFISIAGGQAQEAQIRQTLAQPLQVKLQTADGQPIAGKQVVFRVTQGDGVVGVSTGGGSGGGDEGPAVLVTSDSAGIANTRFRLGARAGSGNQRVTAKAVGFEGEVVFVASATPKPGNKVSVNSGNNQRGALNQPLPLPFVVVVTDDGANVIEGADVEFVVAAGSGKFENGQTHITAHTDSDGRANAKLTLGSEPGLDAQRVTATLVGSPEITAGFTASALQTGAPGATTISGVVLDNQDHPLPGVTLRVDGTTRQALSDAQGRFKITEAPVGPVHLIADGSTTTVPGEWPTLPYNLVTVSGADNPLPAPVYLVKLDTAHAVTVGPTDAEVTVAEVPGFKLTVRAGSVTFPNGDHTGQVSITQVNTSKIPMLPPNGVQPQVIVAIMPTGARFDPPAPLQVPNIDGHPPGAQVEMFSFDHDLEEFVAIGLGTVSADGTVIKSNPGVGVIKAGWHGAAPPVNDGCVANPPLCFRALPGCIKDLDDNDPRVSQTDIVNDCQKPICRNGRVQHVVDPNDFPPDTTPGDCKKSCGTTFTVNDDTDVPADECQACSNGAITPASITNVTALVNGQPEKWQIMSNDPEQATFRFNGTATSNHCKNLRFSWDFGDGATGTGPEFFHTYTAPGNYTATLTVTCDGCAAQRATATARATAIRVTHQTAAVVPSDRSRTDLGVGEEVVLETTPALSLNWSFTGAGQIDEVATGSMLFTAPATASNTNLFAAKPPMLDNSPVVLFKVFKPSTISMTWDGVAIPVGGVPTGVAGVRAAVKVTVGPTNVSFSRIQIMEVGGLASDIHGYWESPDHPPPPHEPVAGWVSVGPGNLMDGFDTIGITNVPPPWSPGRFSFVIPYRYRIVDSGDAQGQPITDVTQRFTLIDATGKISVEKAGACAVRSPGDGIRGTNCGAQP